MGGRRYTRRRILEATGVAGLGGILGTASTAVARQGWTSVNSPTGNTIHGVEHTANGLYACGSGGEIHHRREGKWRTEVKRGPGENSNTLTGAATTDDGERFWVVGNSGTIGEYHTDNGDLDDHSNPLGISSEFTSVSVTGTAGDERLYVGKSSGEVIVGARNDDGGVDWSLSDTGATNTVTAVDFTLSPLDGFVATTGGGVYRTEDGCQTWTDLGIEASQSGYPAILVEDGDPVQVYVGGGSGRIWRLDCDCDLWTPAKAGDSRVQSLEASSDGDRYLGAGASGWAYERADKGAGWLAIETPTGNGLQAAAPADDADGVDVLVGGSGTILER